MTKTLLLYILIIVAIILGCKSHRAKKIEGTWRLVYGKWQIDDTTVYEFPGNVLMDQIKMWSNGHFTFIGKYKVDTSIFDTYGGGTYILNGKRYQEDGIYQSEKDYIGKSLKMILQIKNDTLIQTWPLDANNKIIEKNNNLEKYVRLD